MKNPSPVIQTMKEKSGKKLWGFTVFTTLLIGCIVFCAELFLNSYSKLKLLDQYISEVPGIVKDREEELTMRSRVFEEDITARGKLGTMLYREEKELPETERLEKIRSSVYAESVTLTDENGEILHTTGPVTPADLFEKRIRILEPGLPDSEIYPVSSEDGGTEMEDGKAFVMFPVTGNSGRRLVFEYSCQPLLEVYREIGNWPDVLKRMLSGLEAHAYIRIGEEAPVGYSPGDLTKEEEAELTREVEDVFRRSRRFLRLGNKSSFGIVSFRHRLSLALMQPYQEQNADILLLGPLWDLVCTGVYCAATLSLFLMLSLYLFLVYVVKTCGLKQNIKDKEAFHREVERMARPGCAMVLVAVGCFTIMLQMLESNASIAYIGTTKRMELQNEIKWHEDQREVILSSYTDVYRTRTQALAGVLTEHKEYRTHDELEAFSDMLGADYLMLFGKEGKELVASNSYTGFSVGSPDSNLSEEYRAVLLGYPFAVVGPEKDPYSGRQQIGAAVLLTRDDGLADGFLLAVFDAEALNAELEQESLEYTVGTFAVGRGCKAAVINNEDGVFLAHTDKKMIGAAAKDYITEDAFGRDYAEFTDYDGQNMYVSGVLSGGRSLLFMVPVRPDDRVVLGIVLMIAALLLIIGLFYCPRASRLCALATDEAAERLKYEEYLKPDKRHPLTVFADGYVIFFTLLAGIALVAAYTLAWPAFTFVFGGIWSRGVHLFSVWAALFLLSVVHSAAFLIRRVLAEGEKRTSTRARTMLKLTDSFVAYASGALIVLGILYMFGFNTTALLASAGIVSIAVGMGAKDMAADILAGLFIAIEDSIHMGDIVMVDSWQGLVTDMGIRTLEITDESQNIKILNNSCVSDVVNMSRRKTSCVLELPLERRVNMIETEEILERVVAKALDELPELYGSLKLKGVHSITSTGFTASLSYSCAEAARKAVTKRLQDFMEEQVGQEMEKAADSEDASPEDVSFEDTSSEDTLSEED